MFLQEISDQRHSFVRSRRASVRAFRHGQQHRSPGFHGQQFVAQLLGLGPGLIGVGHDPPRLLVETFDPIVTKGDAGRDNQPVVGDLFSGGFQITAPRVEADHFGPDDMNPLPRQFSVIEGDPGHFLQPADHPVAHRAGDVPIMPLDQDHLGAGIDHPAVAGRRGSAEAPADHHDASLGPTRVRRLLQSQRRRAHQGQRPQSEATVSDKFPTFHRHPPFHGRAE